MHPIPARRPRSAASCPPPCAFTLALLASSITTSDALSVATSLNESLGPEPAAHRSAPGPGCSLTPVPDTSTRGVVPLTPLHISSHSCSPFRSSWVSLLSSGSFRIYRTRTQSCCMPNANIITHLISTCSPTRQHTRRCQALRERRRVAFHVHLLVSLARSTSTLLFTHTPNQNCSSTILAATPS